MNAISFLFNILASAISIYEILCLIYIVMGWFPNARYTRFGSTMRDICEPFLSFFRRFPLRIGMLDFSPILAFAVLALASSIFGDIASYGVLRLGVLLSSLLQICWSLFSSIITFFNIILAIRLVVHLAGKDFSSQIWRTLDGIISPVQSRISSLIFKNRFRTYRAQLAITLAVCIIVQVAGSWIIGFIATQLVKIPF
ncbi:MAG: YggT family protein [Treponema sp.]|nr:YggT family protein [Candidatus Treponema caballi]